MPLYIISTPIGNLEDITIRAVKTLEEVDIILAEDTRRTGILLEKYKVKAKLQSYNDFNKQKITPLIMKHLKEYKKVGIVSDAGTPGISDPGFYLVRECVKEGIRVIPIPGANAAISALVSSGFATDSFTFIGFLPKSNKKKIDLFKEMKDVTYILYESPHRIIKTLEIMSEVIPDRKVCVAREMTKKFEEFIRGSAKEVYEKLKDVKVKGEITIVVDKL